MRELSIQLGAAPRSIEQQTIRAKALYEEQLGAAITVPSKADKYLQAQLTEPLHRRTLDEVVRAHSTDAFHLERLNALSTPHATSWTAASSRLGPLSAEEFRCGLKWILGLPFRPARPV